MSAFLKTLALASFVAAGVGTAAQAVTVDNGLIVGNSLEQGVTESNDVLLIREASQVTTRQPVQVDYLLGTNLEVGVSVRGINTASSAQDLDAGTYNSYLLHFDPLRAGRAEQSFTLADNERIVALIVSNSGLGRLLNQSDDVFGLAGVTYEDNTARRAENNERITLTSANSILFGASANSRNIDNVRVITQVVPLPAGAALMLTGALAFGALRRKS